MDNPSRFWLFWERFLPWAVLGLLLVYTYAEIFYMPYIGFNFILPTGEITPVFVENPLGADLRAGDLLQQVGSISWPEYRQGARQSIFHNLKTGQSLPLQIERNGKRLLIGWTIPGPTRWEILDRVVNTWWLAYLFWLAGTITVLLVRPKDTRWWLLIAFYFLTAIWLVAGNTSRWRIWESAIIFRVATWLAVPIYLHLHWIFPRSLGKLPPFIGWAGYLVSLVLAGLQWVQRLPNNAYLYGFMLALVGSLALLMAHAVAQPSERRALRLLIGALALAVIPTIGVSLAQALEASPWFGYVALLSLPLIPGAYFYATYRYQLGGLELRTNRLIALYTFLILLGTAITILIALATLLLEFPGETLVMSIVATLLTAIVTALWFAPFQRWIERHLLGVRLPPTQLLEIYAARITTSLDLPGLVHTLRDEVLPSLLVRQSVLLRFTSTDTFDSVYAQGVESAHFPTSQAIPALLAVTGTYRPPTSSGDTTPYAPWMRLVLPLRATNRVIGLWVLGKRDPDNFYAQSEIALFQALADQTAIALTNIDQAVQLRMLYQASIDRHEAERTHLAHVLHDEVLHQLAVLFMQSDEIKASPHFDEAYYRLTVRIRQMITGLRPAMMNYGLRAALEEVGEDLAERTGNEIVVQINLAETQGRYATRVEQHVFRIVQQACENALRHARAKTIALTGKLEPGQIHVVVTDDGVGFSLGEPLEISTLLADKHFGLVGMYERAAIIGAELRIAATPGSGTQVTVNWCSQEDASCNSDRF